MIISCNLPELRVAVDASRPRRHTLRPSYMAVTESEGDKKGIPLRTTDEDNEGEGLSSGAHGRGGKAHRRWNRKGTKGGKVVVKGP